MSLIRRSLLLLGALVSYAHGAETPTAQDILAYRSGIVHIGLLAKAEQEKHLTIEKWLGSGFVIDRTCVFATAKHVIAANRERIAVRFRLPPHFDKVRTLPAKVLYENPDNDLAFLKIDQVGNLPCQFGQLNIFPLRGSEILAQLTGKEVVIVGHPVIGPKQTDIPVVRKGIIAATEIRLGKQLMLLLDLTGVPGFSGSPVVLLETGEAIGVVFGPGPTHRAFGFEWATPLTKEDYDSALGKASPKTETQ